jgi:hypothetical protein
MNGDEVVALSVRQPWAHLIVTGRKSVELRSWSTDYRGVLWIHASSKVDIPAAAAHGLTQCFHGGFVGRVILSAIMPMDQDRWVAWRDKHLDRGPYKAGQYGWLLTSPIPLRTPLTAPGRQRLFSPETDVLDDLLGRRRGP